MAAAGNLPPAARPFYPNRPPLVTDSTHSPPPYATRARRQAVGLAAANSKTAVHFSSCRQMRAIARTRVASGGSLSPSSGANAPAAQPLLLFFLKPKPLASPCRQSHSCSILRPSQLLAQNKRPFQLLLLLLLLFLLPIFPLLLLFLLLL